MYFIGEVPVLLGNVSEFTIMNDMRYRYGTDRCTHHSWNSSKAGYSSLLFFRRLINSSRCPLKKLPTNTSCIQMKNNKVQADSTFDTMIVQLSFRYSLICVCTCQVYYKKHCECKCTLYGVY